MKKFTKLTAATMAVAALFFTSNLIAQTTATTATPSPWHLSIGIEPGIPTGNATDISSFEIGGTARLQYNADKSFAVMLTAGYYDFMGKTDPNNSSVKFTSLEMVPVKVGAKYYAAPMFYIDGEAGFGFDMNYENHTKLILSPGIGYDSGSLDIGLRYENYSGNNNSFGLIGLRVAYGFGL